MRWWSDAPFVVGLDEEGPAIGPEFNAVAFDVADVGARARVIKPQLAGCTAELLHERIRKDSAEGQTEARHDDAHRERWSLGIV